MGNEPGERIRLLHEHAPVNLQKIIEAVLKNWLVNQHIQVTGKNSVHGFFFWNNVIVYVRNYYELQDHSNVVPVVYRRLNFDEGC